MSDLLHQHCVPCEGGTAPLKNLEEDAYLSATPGWMVERTGIHQLTRAFQLTNFSAVLDLIQQIGAIAEAEQHHPNLYLHDYKQLRVELYTHAIGGLSVNDFIVAAKINDLPSLQAMI